jgi:hypothetical protein
MHITGTHRGCADGTCPAVHDTDYPGILAIQGTTLTDADALADVGEVPGHETVVLLPRSLFDSYPGKHP